MTLAVLAGCDEKEVILEGERLDPRGEALLSGAVVNRAAPVTLPAMVSNASWTHVGGSATHRVQHPALGTSLSQAWSGDIGEGNGRKHKITADPVISEGRVFTLDSRALVVAHGVSGAPLWSRDLTPAADRSDDASGGGLAVLGGVLYATTGFGSLTAMDTKTGAVLWEQDLDSASTGAPTVNGDTVYVVTRNSVGWAIDAGTGRIEWQVFGATSPSGLVGGPSPVVAGSQIVFPFSSGQMVAAVAGPGTQTWAASVAGERLGRAFSRFSDLTGEPVVLGDTIYAGNQSGRTAAFSATTGQQLWSAEYGAMNPIWVAGGSVFLVSDENQLVRLDASSGEAIWQVDLPFFVRDRISRRETIFSHFGPVLAGGRLIVASDDGILRSFDPVTGDLIRAAELPGPAARNPVVAGGTLYIVTEDGRLHAFR